MTQATLSQGRKTGAVTRRDTENILKWAQFLSRNKDSKAFIC